MTKYSLAGFGSVLVLISIFCFFSLPAAWALNPTPTPAYCQAKVNHLGVDSSDTYSSLGAAVSSSMSGDYIKVSGGECFVTTTIGINHALSIEGGYSIQDWTTPNTRENTTVVHSFGAMGRVFTITSGPTSTVTLKGLHITGGYASSSDHGGAVFAATSSVNLVNNVIYGNYANGAGGAIALYSSYGMLNNNVIMENRSEGGGSAIFLFDSSPAIVQNSIISNYDGASGEVAGDGIFCSGNSNPYIINTLMANQDIGVKCWNSSGSITITGMLASDVTFPYSTGFITVPCSIADGSGIITSTGYLSNFESDSFHLVDGSAAVDAGSVSLPSGAPTPFSYDIDGDPRPNGLPDLGADEFWPTPTPTATEEATNTPEPTKTPEPTNTPEVPLEETPTPAPTPTVSAGSPDVTVSKVSGPAKAQINKRISVSVALKNLNASSSISERFQAGLYLCSRKKINAAKDYLLNKRQVSSLGSSPYSYTARVKLSSRIKPGKYYYGVYADMNKSISESNERNNILFSRKSVTLRK